MSRKRRIASLAFGFAIAAGPVVAQQFSADLVHTGRPDKPDKLYVSDGKARLEQATGKTILGDAQAKTASMLTPPQKTYIDLPGGGPFAIFMPADPNNACPQWLEIANLAKANRDAEQWGCKRIGDETVNGRHAIKYQSTSPRGGIDYAWVDPSLKFLIKSRDANGSGVDLLNIKEAAQPESLFQIPADYQKADTQQMMQQPAGAGEIAPRLGSKRAPGG